MGRRGVSAVAERVMQAGEAVGVTAYENAYERESRLTWQRDCAGNGYFNAGARLAAGEVGGKLGAR
jgi:hypothetical protein